MRGDSHVRFGGRVNQGWIGDYLVGPSVPFPKVTGSKLAKLGLYVDDRVQHEAASWWSDDSEDSCGSVAGP